MEIGAKKEPDLSLTLLFARQLPILAGSFPPTTFGVKKLNCCVRHGNRCILLAIITTLTVHAGFEPAISSVTGRRDKPLLQWTKIAGAGFEPTTFGL